MLWIDFGMGFVLLTHYIARYTTRGWIIEFDPSDLRGWNAMVEWEEMYRELGGEG